METEFNDMNSRELLSLLKYHARMVSSITEKLTAAGIETAELAPASDEPDAPSSRPADSDLYEAVAPVFVRAGTRTKRNLLSVLEDITHLEAVGEPVPERSRSGKPPRYVRLVAEGKTFAYIQVRRESLRVDIAAPKERVNEIPNARPREVREENPFQVSVFVNGDADLPAAKDALRFAFNLQHGEPVA